MQSGTRASVPPDDCQVFVGFVKRSLELLTGPSSLIHTHHFSNIDKKRTAKRTEERLGTLTARRYVPRSVFVGERAWVIEMVDTQFGYFGALPPTAARTLQYFGTFDRRVREAVVDAILPGPSSIYHTHHFANIDGKRTAKRTEERLGTLKAPRYVPRSVFVGDRAWVIAMVNANAVT